MSRNVVIFVVGAAALGWSCRSVPPSPDRPPPHPVVHGARWDPLEPDGPVLDLKSPDQAAAAPPAGGEVPRARTEDDNGALALGETSDGSPEGDALSTRVGTETRASGVRSTHGEARSEPPGAEDEIVPAVGNARDTDRGSRRYVLSGKDDGTVHLEVFERPPDEPRLRLGPSLPSRLPDYSEPPEEIRNRLRRIRCVPCP